MCQKALQLERSNEMKGLRVNAGKIKIIICGKGLDLLQSSGEFPCPVCHTGVGSNSIFCKGCGCTRNAVGSSSRQRTLITGRVLARNFKTCVRDSLLGIIWRPRMKNMRTGIRIWRVIMVLRNACRTDSYVRIWDTLFTFQAYKTVW